MGAPAPVSLREQMVQVKSAEPEAEVAREMVTMSLFVSAKARAAWDLAVGIDRDKACERGIGRS